MRLTNLLLSILYITMEALYYIIYVFNLLYFSFNVILLYKL